MQKLDSTKSKKKVSLKNVKVERNIIGKVETLKFRSAIASNLAKDDKGQNFQKN
jgi:hypothetical protein